MSFGSPQVLNLNADAVKQSTETCVHCWKSLEAPVVTLSCTQSHFSGLRVRAFQAERVQLKLLENRIPLTLVTCTWKESFDNVLICRLGKWYVQSTF